MMKIETNKIVVLGNGEAYLVVSYVTNNNRDYYYIAEYDKEVNDIKDNYKIVEAIKKNDNIYLEEVIGEVNLKTILPLFVNNIVNN